MAAGVLVAWVVTMAASLNGCEERVVKSGWESLDPVTGGGYYDAPKPGASAAEVPADARWSIATDQYVGIEHRRLAEQRALQLGRATGMQGFWVAEEGQGSTIYFGSYKSPQQPEAQRDLALLRRQNNTQGLRLTALMIVPIVPKGSTQIVDMDLRSASGRGAYTLQIGYYEGAPGAEAEARKAAEQAAATLRKDGHDAYFFHGPNRSMVTVGVFGDDAILSSNEGQRIRTEYSLAVQQLQQQFPHNLANGMVIEETRGGGPTIRQPSFLVRIPAAR